MNSKRSFVLLAIMIGLAVIATSMTISYSSNRAFAQTLPPEAAPQATDHSVLGGGTCPPEQQHPCR